MTTKREAITCRVCGKQLVVEQEVPIDGSGELIAVWYVCPDRCALAAASPEADAGTVTERKDKQSD